VTLADGSLFVAAGEQLYRFSGNVEDKPLL
jgi:hypothetical protein